MTQDAPWEDQVLCAVLNRIIPADRDPGALDLGADVYVRRQLTAGGVETATAVSIGLRAIAARALAGHGVQFGQLVPAEQDYLLEQCVGQEWFAVLCELAAEGFYGDPANGGNRGARSWAMIGYQHGLPDGPSGPCGPAP